MRMICDCVDSALNIMKFPLSVHHLISLIIRMSYSYYYQNTIFLQCSQYRIGTLDRVPY